MVPRTPNQTAQGSSFFMGHSCCCFKSHPSFISSALLAVSVCKWFLLSCAKPTVMFCCCAAGGNLSLVHELQFHPLNFQTSSPINYHLIPSYVHVQQWGSVHGQCWRRKWIENLIFWNNSHFLHHLAGVPRSLKAAQKANTSCGFWLTRYRCSQADVVKMFWKCCLETSLLILFLLSPGSRTSLRAD